MKVSYNWLKETVDIPVDPDALAKALTMVGLQLESKQPYEEDTTLDIEVTVNRPDCLSVYGLAREIALIFGSPPPAIKGLHQTQVIPFRTNDGRYSGGGKDLRILIEDADLCPRFCGQIVTGIKVGPSPSWMQKKLEACGLRSISNVVDITNYVMLELGQPMHAYDFDTLAGGTIRVRKARNEKLLMIDGKERPLSDSMLAIADAERVIGVGGVMGGMETEVTESTTNVLLEAAYFQPASVRRTAKTLELSTDASYRFERGADYKMQANACLRAAVLLEQCAGGTVHPVVDVCPGKFVPAEIRLRQPRIARILGQTIDPHLADNILTALGFIKKAENLWQVPSFRVDIFREIDLIEEIARHFGYNNIPSTLPKAEKRYQADHSTFQLERAVNQFLRGAGLEEAYTFSFVNESTEEAIRIINPLSEIAPALRTSLLPGLQESVAYNLRHRNEDVRLFEIGRVFLPETEKIALGIAMLVEHRDLKGIMESMLSALLYGEPTIRDGSIFVEGKNIGRMIQTHSESQPLQLCEIYLSDLIQLPQRRLTYNPLIPYPFVERDVSFLISSDVRFSQLEDVFNRMDVPALRAWKLVDRYQGKNIPSGKVSLSLRFTFQATDRTLTSEEVDRMFDTIVRALSENFAIELR
ncbi:phenylalanine--tRNA ligase subunit beta [bacterium]|nr:phenylalanine--tRNA ligase subunit beta [bacterium]MCI0606795.1 phenylalanine--tRNA ligase subunit beta [bacterium]